MSDRTGQMPVTFIGGPKKIAGTNLVLAGDSYPPTIEFERMVVASVALTEWTTELGMTAVAKAIIRYERTEDTTPDGRRVYRAQV